MERQLLKDVAHRVLQRYKAMPSNEFRAIINDHQYRGLFHEISEMTLSEADIEKITHACEYLNKKLIRTVPLGKINFQTPNRRNSWGDAEIDYYTSQKILDLPNSISGFQQESQTTLSWRASSRVPQFVLAQLKVTVLQNQPLNEQPTFYYGKDENIWQLSTQAA